MTATLPSWSLAFLMSFSCCAVVWSEVQKLSSSYIMLHFSISFRCKHIIEQQAVARPDTTCRQMRDACRSRTVAAKQAGSHLHISVEASITESLQGQSACEAHHCQWYTGALAGEDQGNQAHSWAYRHTCSQTARNSERAGGVFCHGVVSTAGHSMESDSGSCGAWPGESRSDT